MIFHCFVSESDAFALTWYFFV